MRFPVAPIAEEQAEPCGRLIRDCIDHAIACVGEGRGHNRERGAA